MIIPAEAVLALRREELEQSQLWTDLFVVLALVPSVESESDTYDLLQLGLDIEYSLTGSADILGPIVESLETEDPSPEEEREAVQRGRALLCRLQGIRPPPRS